MRNCGAPAPVSVFSSSYDGAMSSKTPLFCFQIAKSPGDEGNGCPPRAGFTVHTATMLPGSLYGRGAISTVFTTEKIAVLAPIPNASVATLTHTNPGDFTSSRTQS